MGPTFFSSQPMVGEALFVKRATRVSYNKFKLPSACCPMAAEAQFVERAMAFSYNEFKLPSAYNKLKLRSAWGPRGSAIPSLSRLSDFNHISYFFNYLSSSLNHISSLGLGGGSFEDNLRAQQLELFCCAPLRALFTDRRGNTNGTVQTVPTRAYT